MRTNLILFALAVVLAIPTYFTLWGGGIELTDIKEIPRVIEGFDKTKVNFVLVRQLKPKKEGKSPNPEAAPEMEQIAFVRNLAAGRWEIYEPAEMRGLPVKQDHVDKHILEHVQEMRYQKDTLFKADASEQDLKDAGLHADNGQVIVCRKNPEDREDLAVIVKGNRSSREAIGIQGYYVRRHDNDKEIILYEPTDENWEILFDTSEWIEKTIHTLGMGDIETFELKNDQGHVVFLRKPGSAASWIVDEKFRPKNAGPLKQGELQQVMEQFLKVKAEKYLAHKGALTDEQLKQLQLQESKAKIEVAATLKDGDRVSLRIGVLNRESGGHFTLGSRSDHMFSLPTFVAKRFDIDPADLFGPK